MNLNLTLLGQSISFLIFVWICWKFVWPPILKALEEREEKISEGLNAAHKAEQAYKEAKKEIEQKLQEAKEESRGIIIGAEKMASAIKQKAHEDMSSAYTKKMNDAQAEIEMLYKKAKNEIAVEIVEVAMLASAKIVEQKVSQDEAQSAVEKVLKELKADYSV